MILLLSLSNRHRAQQAPIQISPAQVPFHYATFLVPGKPIGYFPKIPGCLAAI
jgi:hypothetical protein